MAYSQKRLIIISLQGIGNNIFINALIKKIKTLLPDFQIDIIVRTPVIKVFYLN